MGDNDRAFIDLFPKEAPPCWPRPLLRNKAVFFDPEYICEHLIPADSFYRRFCDTVAPLITDDLFADMYCPDNGRPPIPPKLLALATILQFHRNLSDREMEREI